MTMACKRACLLLFLAILTNNVRADDWPQWLGPKRDGIWRETGLVSKFPEGGPKVRWRTPIGEGYAGPVVADGRVFVMDRILASGVKNPDDPFEKTTRVDGKERVLCLNESDGKILWKHEYDCAYQISYASGPRTPATVSGGKVYALGAMGDLLCLGAEKGDVLWSKSLPTEFSVYVPVWGFAAPPLVDGNRLICLVGGKGSVCVAFDKDTGKELWRALSAKEPGYAPPMIYEVDGKRQLIVWHPESINSLDPETGKLYWSQKYGDRKIVKAGLAVPTPRLDGDKLFLTAFYDGAVLLQLNGTKQPGVVWKRHGRSEEPDDTDGLHSIMSTPTIKDGHIYGIDSYGELRCLSLQTGERLWSTHEPAVGKSQRWGHAFFVAQGDRFVFFNEKGDLILANLSPKGYEEIGRANILEPTNTMAGPKGRRVIWSHPAFANRSVYARNDREIICVSLAAK